MWIFGYGSLVWKVDFPYTHKLIGYVKGYERRFWQASIDHRGTPEQPGRVVTLIPSQDPEARVWGVAYSVPDTDLTSLHEREKRFSHHTIPFYPRGDTGEVISCTAFVSDSSTNPLYLGPAPLQEMVEQMATRAGPSGTNAEYVLKLAEWHRSELLEEDPHLSEIEAALRARLARPKN